MKTDYSALASPANIPQTEPLPGAAQVQNAAGGFVYQLAPLTQLERFLVLGATGGTYYVSERKLVQDNAGVIIDQIKASEAYALDALRMTVQISVSGRAPSNDPAIFVLALLCTHGNEAVRKQVYLSLNEVCRIGTDIFHFCHFIGQLRKWSAGLRRAVARWYTSKSPDQLGFQMMKYQQRDGMTHASVLRLCHAQAAELSQHNALFRFAVQDSGQATVAQDETQQGVRRVVRRNDPKNPRLYQMPTALPQIIQGLIEMRRAASVKEVIRLIETYRLPREAVPTQWLNEVSVWEALLVRMPVKAMVRSLAKMTAVGLLAPLSVGANLVRDRLSDGTMLHKSRLHPFQVLLASRIYGKGSGDKGSLTWTPVQSVIDALDAAFYLCFGNVVPSGLPTVLGLDISGSMDTNSLQGSILTAREGAAAMALVTAATEPYTVLLGYTASLTGISAVTELQISPRMRLDEVAKYMRGLPMGRTDCALPMLWASARQIPNAHFVSYTDNETYAGHIHVSQALARYRKEYSPGARSVAVGMTATAYTVNDPQDALCLDVAGFDGGAPAIIANFIRGSGPAETPQAEE